MRISDWSSDVCSSDLDHGARLIAAAKAGLIEGFGPGFRYLIAHLRGIACNAHCNDGVWRLPGGDAYYAAQLRWNTTLPVRSEEHTSALQSLMRISYAVFCLKNKNESLIYHIYTYL